MTSTIGSLFPILWSLAFLSPVVAIFFAVRFYSLHCRRRPEPDRRFPFVAYILVLLVCAIIAFPFGLIFGASSACSTPGFGNLCGLYGFFVTGPSASALAIFLISGLITLVPADDAAVPVIPVDDAPIHATTRWYRKLWYGQYSLARSFWGFFILGTFVGMIIRMNPVFLFLPVAQPVLLGYEIAAGVGVWRSANALIATRGPSVTYTESMKIIAAKTVVALVVGIHGILLLRTVSLAVV
jgi:hypothetical protein